MERLGLVTYKKRVFGRHGKELKVPKTAVAVRPHVSTLIL